MQKSHYSSVDASNMKYIFPIFGSSGSENNNPTDTNNQQNNNQNTQQQTDPIKSLQSDPVALAQLLQQSQTLQSQIDSLNTQLTTANSKVGEFEAAKTEAERAQQTKEENLETDLANERAKVEKRDKIIAEKLLENAIASNGKYKWHSIKDVLSNIDVSKLTFDIDIDNGKASIKGVDAELDRIATADPWRVAQSDGNNNNSTSTSTQVTRPSSSVPRPPQQNMSKDEKRKIAEAKYPSLRARG